MSMEDDQQSMWRMLQDIGRTARSPNAGLRPRRPPTPFTLFSGFLGAGKTTVLCRLLEHQDTRRIAVLVNDFGTVNVDAAIVRRRTSQTIELANGCVCCGLSAGLDQVLSDLLALPDPPQAIILEASGVAEPIGIVHVALSQPGLSLDGVITVVDAAAIASQRRDPLVKVTVERQIAASDLVVLTKLDLLDVRAAEAAREEIRAVAPTARIVDAANGDVGTEVLLGIGAGPHRSLFVEGPHENQFHTWTVSVQGALDRRRLCALAGDLPISVLRVKGLVRLANDPLSVHLFQVVGRRWSLTREGERRDREGASDIVVIGAPRSEDVEAVTQALLACATPPAS
jgi:G3E family GTPase